MPPQRIQPGAGQESVWDYPRPPALEPANQLVQVIFNGTTLAETRQAQRVLETSHPPVYYIPPSDVRLEFLTATSKATYCEWKGRARYYTIEVGNQRVENAAWAYPDPTDAFSDIRDYLAFYPSRMEACYVDGERVKAQAGDFYGGWITQNIVGPFKGEPGSWGW
ncbi:MAG: DUF427 domain-containing protein [Leptolyngbya sp. SIO4C1]|nr:DUF427 domain-containing protein [Leptolyngbya sp. SIO4C1]